MQGIIGAPERIITVDSNDSIETAAAKMLKHKIGCLVVNNENGEFLGVVTERDIVNRAVAASRNGQKTTVGEIMTTNVLCCSPETPTSEARKMMATNGIRHLPIVEDGRVVGMLSARDLMGRQLEEDRAAAEEVAMLSTCLKSIDLAEVAAIVVREVPKLFGAGRCVLCLDKDSRDSQEPLLVSCKDCLCPREYLKGEVRELVSAERPPLRFDSVPDVCEARGAESPRLVIPLGVCERDDSGNYSQERLPGFLCTCGMVPSAATNTELLSYKAKLAREILNSHLSNARLYQKARLTSLTDPLTGVGSRKLLEDKLQAESVRTKRYGHVFSVAIIDLDNFKMINDVLGHGAGDEALVKLASCMKEQKRAPDVLARYGGDEFVILMPETKAVEAVKLMERLRAAAAKIRMPDDLPITISCGLAESPREHANLVRELMQRADLALYAAKSAGRNCVKTWDQSMSKLVSPDDLELDRIKKLQRRIAGLSEKAEQMFIQSIWGLVQALEAKDTYAKKHSEHVTHYAAAIAEVMGVSPKQREVIRRAAMIHDIGKIGIPDAILSKPDRLTPRQRGIVEQHPLIAVRILEKMTFLEREIDLVRHHHEKWNGQGYPDGLSGEAIPKGARIMAVADTFDALTSSRSYRDSRSIEQAMTILTDSAGYDFDPEAVKGLVLWVDQVAQARGKAVGELVLSDLLGGRSEAEPNRAEERERIDVAANAGHRG